MNFLLKATALVFCLTLSFNIFSQERHYFPRTLSIDVSSIVNISTGAEPGFNELELKFTEFNDKRMTRFKFSLNDRNVYESELIRSELLEDNAPDNLLYLVNNYRSNKNYRISIGAAKIVQKNKLSIYYGLDFNIGLNTGTVSTLNKEIKVNSTFDNLISTKKENIFFTGITPIIGTNFDIGTRLYFGIEFGIEFNYLFGDIHYLDKSMNYQPSNFGRIDFNPIRMLNDLSLGIKF